MIQWLSSRDHYHLAPKSVSFWSHLCDRSHFCSHVDRPGRCKSFQEMPDFCSLCMSEYRHRQCHVESLWENIKKIKSRVNMKYSENLHLSYFVWPRSIGTAALQLYHIYLHSQKRYLAIFLLILEGFVNVEYKSLQSIVQ